MILAKIPIPNEPHQQKFVSCLQILLLASLVPLAFYINNVNHIYVDYSLATVVAIFIAFYSKETIVSQTLFMNRPMQFIGKASFSIYLTHDMIFYYTKKYMQMGGWNDIGVIAILAFIAALVLGGLMYRFFEIPTNAFLKNKLTQAYKIVQSRKTVFA